MQVDSKPSPWPCVVMLVGLLLCCLTAPWFWRRSNAPESPSDTSVAAPSNELAGPSIEPAPAAIPGQPTPKSHWADLGIDSALVRPIDGPVANNNWVVHSPPPTIEEFINAERFGSLRFNAGTDWRHTDWSRWPMVFVPPGEPAEPWRETDAANVAVTIAPNPLVVAALERVGKALAAYSISDALIRLAARADVLSGWLSNHSPAVSRIQIVTAPVQDSAPTIGSTGPTLRWIDPSERLAMRSGPEPVTTPVYDSAETSEAPAETPDSLTPPIADTDKADDPWGVPQALFDQLERLSRHPLSAQWAQETIDELQNVTTQANWDSSDVAQALSRLSALADEAARLAETTADSRLGVELRRAHWAILRRLECWRTIGEIHVAVRSNERIAANGSLHSLFGGLPQPADARTDLPALTRELESYESSRDPQLARQIAQEQQSLRSSPDAFDQSLAEAVEQHYRNANVRMAISASMLNRMVAQRRSEIRAVRDRIAGTPVRGRSHTHSESFVRLEPATGRWQLDVQTQGVVESDTLANGGRARLRSFGATDFTAQKSIVVDTEGVRTQSALVDATNYNRLVGVRTEYDWLPLVGAYARSQAVRQYRAKRPRAKAEVEAKVVAQAQEEVDRDTCQAIERIEHDIRTRFTNSIAQAGIDVTPIEMTTTAERLVARLRVAGHHQLGSHTPRPRALSDSLASLQLHESALTNAAVSLQLDGARFTAPELQQLLRDKFPALALAEPPQTKSDTIFEFAYRDAVQFRIADGRIELLLAMTSFEHGGRRARDFIVHAYYVPVVDGLAVDLVRDGTLGIEGRLSATDRARLHNAFNSVLAEDRRISIVRLENPNDPRLAGLMITQMVLEDGWVGLAVGPTSADRTAEHARSLR